jgi:hypothetical protein
VGGDLDVVKRLVQEGTLISEPKSKRLRRTKTKRLAKIARNELDIQRHLREASTHIQSIKSADVMGPVNGEYWVDVISPKRSAWGWNTVAMVKKEMKRLIPSAKYNKYFEGSKDNPDRTVYFKVPEGAELRGVHYSDYEMEEI